MTDVAGGSEKPSFQERLAGVLAFPVTPFSDSGKVDLDGLAFNASWLANFPLAAIVAPSGTGELFTLSESECADVLRETVKAVEGRCPVVAGVGHGPTTGAEMARRAEASGADALLILPPYYPDPDSVGLVEYYRQVAGATSLPFMIYARGSAQVTAEQVVDLASSADRFIAFKEGRNDVRRFQQIRSTVERELGHQRLRWLSGVGDDVVGPFFAAGAEGYTSSLACFWPETSLELLDAARANETVRMARLQAEKVAPFYDLRAGGQGLEVSVMKSAMRALGLPAGGVRAPLASTSIEADSLIRELVVDLGIPSAQERSRLI